jgi:hypothetical protein
MLKTNDIHLFLGQLGEAIDKNITLYLIGGVNMNLKCLK